MLKVVTTFAAAAALALVASGASAECFGGHSNVTASNDAQSKQTITMSTFDGTVLQPTLEQPRDRAEAVGAECPEGEKDCTPGTE